jgi:acetylornithine deacetylase/succinyl-diaminopimelate desuccinylase-like protein
MDSAEVKTWLEPRADAMASLLEELVAIDTENPPGRRLGRCGRLLQNAMRGLGVQAELLEMPATAELEEPYVVRAVVGEDSRTIYFSRPLRRCARPGARAVPPAA